MKNERTAFNINIIPYNKVFVKRKAGRKDNLAYIILACNGALQGGILVQVDRRLVEYQTNGP